MLVQSYCKVIAVSHVGIGFLFVGFLLSDYHVFVLPVLTFALALAVASVTVAVSPGTAYSPSNAIPTAHLRLAWSLGYWLA